MIVLAADQRDSSTSGPVGIPNFAWVEERLVARGQQPLLTLEAYQELQRFGISAVLSLRPAQEYLDEPRRRYDVAEERALCGAAGLAFHHVAFTDYQAPHPSQVVRALAILSREVEQGGTVYVHCFAGIGRTGVITGAWQILRGASGTEVLRRYAEFCWGGWNRIVALRSSDGAVSSGRATQASPLQQAASSPFAGLQSVDEFFHAIGARHQAWVLLTIADVLGLPAEPLPDFVQPQRPPNGRTWRRRFREQLQRHLGLAMDLLP